MEGFVASIPDCNQKFSPDNKINFLISLASFAAAELGKVENEVDVIFIEVNLGLQGRRREFMDNQRVQAVLRGNFPYFVLRRRFKVNPCKSPVNPFGYHRKEYNTRHLEKRIQNSVVSHSFYSGSLFCRGFCGRSTGAYSVTVDELEKSDRMVGMQQVGRNIRLTVTALLLIGVVFFAGFSVGERRIGSAEAAPSLAGKELPQDLSSIATDFSPFWSVWKTLDEKFVTAATTTSSQEKVWGAISGLTASLKDPYTVFLPPEESKLFETEISGNFEGVGMEIGIKDNLLTVVAPLKGTPAERAGIRPGDKILKINGEVSTSFKVEQAVKLIRGPRGTTVSLTISREGAKEPFEVKIVRAIIDIPTISTKVKSTTATTTEELAKGAVVGSEGVVILELYNFSATSPRLFRDALRSFIESGSNKLIIDLRGNPGGFLEAAVELASWFLPAGTPVVIEDFGKQKEKRVHRSRGYNIFNENLKLAILVNNGSASASEILAGALREHGKAILVGGKTFGKGSVQELVKITPDTSLKVTVARWLTPNGVSISEGGLTPDVEVTMTPEDLEKKRDPQREKAIKLLTGEAE